MAGATLFFDTETTGTVSKWNAPISDPTHPDVVQLAAILRDDETKLEISTVNVIVKPEGWIISPGAANVHGIKQEFAEKFGVSIENAAYLFGGMMSVADTIVAHNINFDSLIMKRALWRAGVSAEDVAARFASCQPRCTMLTSVNIVRVPHKRPRHPTDFKWPKLEECSQYFFKESVVGAHDALVDVRMTIRVYDELVKMKAFEEAA